MGSVAAGMETCPTRVWRRVARRSQVEQRARAPLPDAGRGVFTSVVLFAEAPVADLGRRLR